MSPTVVIVLLSLVATSLSVGIPYIAGGEKATFIDFYPWQGSVHTEQGQFLCGCSLITTEWAVTAASCVQSTHHIVRFGSINRSEGTPRAVVEIIIHEDYEVSGSYYRYNDVAVMRFAPLTLSEKIKPIPLGETDEVGNTNCYITGWGKLHYSNATYPETLHLGKTTVVANSNCDDYWPYINSTHVCTQRYSSYPQTCKGDEGGPLACLRGDHYELVGISSWQLSSCASYNPVFSRVSYFKLWILGKTRAAQSENIHE